jgi:hypothetical protein
VPLLIGFGGLGWAAVRRRRAHSASAKPDAPGVQGETP